MYPLSRGLAPVLVLFVGAVALGEDASGSQIAGVVLVAAGVVLVHGLRRPSSLDALALALGIAVCIASYTLLDARGIRHAAPITYLELSMIPATIGYGAVVLAVKGRGGSASRSAHRRSWPGWPRSAPMRLCWRHSRVLRLRRSPRCASRAS